MAIEARRPADGCNEAMTRTGRPAAGARDCIAATIEFSIAKVSVAGKQIFRTAAIRNLLRIDRGTNRVRRIETDFWLGIRLNPP
jgi:hypothetical protein